jgi:hypothetical protein
MALSRSFIMRKVSPAIEKISAATSGCPAKSSSAWGRPSSSMEPSRGPPGSKEPATISRLSSLVTKRRSALARRASERASRAWSSATSRPAIRPPTASSEAARAARCRLAKERRR